MVESLAIRFSSSSGKKHFHELPRMVGNELEFGEFLGILKFGISGFVAEGIWRLDFWIGKSFDSQSLSNSNL